jgi:tetratricopeptide (TPR) repeat protein
VKWVKLNFLRVTVFLFPSDNLMHGLSFIFQLQSGDGQPEGPHYLRTIWCMALFAWFTILSCSQDSRTPMPEIEYTGMEPSVITKLQTLKGAVEVSPDSAQLWGRLASNLYIHDLKRESIACFEKALALDPAEFRWLYYGAIARTEMDYDDATDWYERSRKLRPDYVPMLARLAQTYFHKGNLQKATKLFNQVIAEDAHFTQAYIGLAQIAVQQGRLDDAKHCLVKAIALNPQQREAHALLSDVHRRLGKLDSSEIELAVARSLPAKTGIPDPIFSELVSEGVSSFWYRFRGSNHLANRRYDQAVQEFRKALQARPDAEAYNNLGFALQHQNKYDEAAEFHRKAIALDSTYAEAYNNLGVVLYKQGAQSDAIDMVRTGLQYDPELRDAYLNLGTFLKSAGRRQEAIDAFRQGRKRDPHNMVFLQDTSNA